MKKSTMSGDPIRDRDAAFIEVILTGKQGKLREYCEFYRVFWPQSERARLAGVYKAAQYCPAIPSMIRKMAAEKCKALGFEPIIPADILEEVIGEHIEEVHDDA